MAKGLREKVAQNRDLPASKLSALAILLDGRTVGMYTINAHVRDQASRGRGVGLASYPKACRVFLERFGLKRILFKTPARVFELLALEIDLIAPARPAIVRGPACTQPPRARR